MKIYDKINLVVVMKKERKYILSIMLFLFLFFITFFYIFSKYPIQDFFSTLKACNKYYIILSIVCVIAYLMFNVLFLKKCFHPFKEKLTFKQALAYTCTEIYFSAITPSSTGGQPAELYYMTKDGIPLEKSTIVILVNTILYKLSILILGVLSILLVPNYLLNNGVIFTLLLALGMLLDIFIIVLFLILLFSKKTMLKLLKIILKIFAFFHINKNVEQKEKDWKASFQKYQECAFFIKENPAFIIKLFIIILFQRISLFFVSYFVYRSFGLDAHNFLEIIAIQIGVTLAIDSVPLPGGVMIGEKLTHQITKLIYTENLAISSMLIIRGISFYLLVLISAMIYVIYHLNYLKRKQKR